MLKRFPILDAFIAKHKRSPNNLEIAKMFKVAGPGQSTKDILTNYKKQLLACHACGQKTNA